jgi:dTDP-4-amino-4,6-dideoxygalactose transaminase
MFPVAEMCAEELVSLPMFPELAKAEIEYVVTEIKKWIVSSTGR